MQNIVEGELLSAYQELTAEMQRLQAQPRPAPRTPVDSVGGIPVDSEYVVFIIDTSNSMVGNHWESTVNVMNEALDIYPTVKGLQVYEQELTKNTSERERLTREFGADIQRFKELKGIK